MAPILGLVSLWGGKLDVDLALLTAMSDLSDPQSKMGIQGVKLTMSAGGPFYVRGTLAEIGALIEAAGTVAADLPIEGDGSAADPVTINPDKITRDLLSGGSGIAAGEVVVGSGPSSLDGVAASSLSPLREAANILGNGNIGSKASFGGVGIASSIRNAAGDYTIALTAPGYTLGSASVHATRGAQTNGQIDASFFSATTIRVFTFDEAGTAEDSPFALLVLNGLA